MTNHRFRILIVDDEPFNVDYLEQELEEFGYDLIIASNGQEALEKIQSESPDLVLLDIMMPVMDGFAVLEKLKVDGETQTIPVIVISANNDLQSVVKGINMGAEDYLPKPFEPVILHARISASLERKRLRDLERLHLQSLEREMNIARDIQKEFLPYELPSIQGWEVAAYFKAAKDVAGDFYDSFLLPDGNLVCVIGDVCGKGVGAALFMTLFRSLIRATSTSSDFSKDSAQILPTPAERLLHAVSFTNNYVARIHEASSMFATVFICLVEVETGITSYINAGNDLPYLLHLDGSLEELLTCGPVIGALENAKFKVYEICLNQGESLVAFTDGIPDTKNSRDEFFGYERLKELVTGKFSSPAEGLNLIGDHLAAFAADSEQFDDITLLAVKRTGI